MKGHRQQGLSLGKRWRLFVALGVLMLGLGFFLLRPVGQYSAPFARDIHICLQPYSCRCQTACFTGASFSGGEFTGVPRYGVDWPTKYLTRSQPELCPKEAGTMAQRAGCTSCMPALDSASCWEHMNIY